MSLATKDAFLAGEFLKKEPFELPNGKTVLLRQLSVEQVAAFRKLHTAALAAEGDTQLVELMVTIFIQSAVDANGASMFTAADHPALMQNLSADLVGALGMKVLQMQSGNNEGDAEEVVKNSESDQSTASASI